MKNVFLLALALAVCVMSTGCISSLIGDDEEETFTIEAGILQNISRVTDDGISKTSVTVSPDGKMLLYTEFTGDAEQTDIRGFTTSESQIVLLRNINSPAKTKLPLTWSYTPAWYPDSKTIVCAGFEDKMTKLIRSSIDGGGKTYLTRSVIGKSDLHPCVKDKKIVCDTVISGKSQIISMNLDGTEVTILCEGETPSWHPSENKLVFIRNGGICELNIDSGQTTEIYKDEKSPCSLPSYSADGKQILFTQLATVNTTASNALKKIVFGSNVNQIFLMNADGTGRTQLTSGNQSVFGATWGADNTVFFIARINNKTDIWKAKISKSE